MLKSDGELRVVAYTDRFGRTINRFEIDFTKGNSKRSIDDLIKKGKAVLSVKQTTEIEVVEKNK